MCARPWHFYGWWGMAYAQLLVSLAPGHGFRVRCGEQTRPCVCASPVGVLQVLSCYCDGTAVMVDVWRHEEGWGDTSAWFVATTAAWRASSKQVNRL